jgi:carbon-monoxide dehydrogenase small subunit
VPQAFRVAPGRLCGFCTPGFVVTATALLRETPAPRDDEIRVGISGTLCRCPGYLGTIAAFASLAAGGDTPPAAARSAADARRAES